MNLVSNLVTPLYPCYNADSTVGASKPKCEQNTTQWVFFAFLYRPIPAHHQLQSVVQSKRCSNPLSPIMPKYWTHVTEDKQIEEVLWEGTYRSPYKHIILVRQESVICLYRYNSMTMLSYSCVHMLYMYTQNMSTCSTFVLLCIKNIILKYCAVSYYHEFSSVCQHRTGPGG